MESGGQAFAGKVCHTCGHAGFVESISTCSLCRVISQHKYCMRTLLYEVPEGWHCEDCLLNAGADAYGPTVEEEATRARCLAYGKQDMQSIRTSRKTDAGKVKFITAKEVSTLESGLTSSWKGISRILSHRGDLRNVMPKLKSQKSTISAPDGSKEVKVSSRPLNKPANALEDISRSKHFLQSKRFNEKKGPETSSQICKKQRTDYKLDAAPYKSFLNFARPSEAACGFIADSLHDQGGPTKLQDNCLVVEELTKAPLAAKEPRDLDKGKDSKDLPVNNSGTASCSIPQFVDISSQEMSLPHKLVISSDEKFHHALEPCWRGAFELLGIVMVVHGGVRGYLSCQVSPKVYDISKQLPGTLKFKVLPREIVWPQIFKLYPPTRNDVALHFFCEEERQNDKYDHFVQQVHSCDYALQGFVADAELLLFSSAQLQSDSEKCGRKIYFWGVFRHVRQKRATQRRGKPISYCSSTPMYHNHDKLQVPLDDNSMVADMEIDMVGGCHIGAVDMPIPKLVTPWFSKPLQKAPKSFTLKKTNSTLLDTPPGFPFPIYKDKRKQETGTPVQLPLVTKTMG